MEIPDEGVFEYKLITRILRRGSPCRGCRKIVKGLAEYLCEREPIVERAWWKTGPFHPDGCVDEHLYTINTVRECLRIDSSADKVRLCMRQKREREGCYSHVKPPERSNMVGGVAMEAFSFPESSG